MAQLICFDVGNVLVRLKSFTHAVDKTKVEQYSHLTQLYGVGRLARQEFLNALRALFEWRCELSDIESWFVHHRIEGPQPGSDKLLAQLHKSGVTVSLLSNTNASHWAYLSSLELFQPRLISVLSFEQRCAKPDIEIYRRLEELTGFNSAEIIFFDDLEVNTLAADRLGWITRQVAPPSAIDDIYKFLQGHGVL
ncbi:HAD-IA family hydrolase [Pseudomonas fluorescens]|uniref:HAD-IA family hydrolase n=1 Tax=Pseudomonas fluorescens TaxID=294 RepID=UPI00093629DF|nr:HAD-IA family hydrolase [Pseudomonas fluorescens]